MSLWLNSSVFAPINIVNQTIQTAAIRAYSGSIAVVRDDALAVEEPLEIRLGYGAIRNRSRVTIATTMRTPGHDAELAMGFLFAEGVLKTSGDVLQIEQSEANVIKVELHPDVAFDPAHFQRLTTTTSACGVCGKRTIAELEDRLEPIRSTAKFSPEIIRAIAAKFRTAQPGFDRTGGLHAAGLFDLNGEIVNIREDVGRHNALDKLVGAEFQSNRFPLANRLIFVSGRASYELVQKAIAAGAAVLAAVGAPSSLAVDLARAFDLTLLGFVREGRFNVYAGDAMDSGASDE